MLDVNELILTLPFPPSANHIWRARRGASTPYLSEEYRAFIANVSAVALAKNARVSGRVSIEMRLSEPDNRKRDIDNRIKPTLDALTKARVIDDDSCVDRLVIYRARGAKVARLDVRITKYKPNKELRLC